MIKLTKLDEQPFAVRSIVRHIYLGHTDGRTGTPPFGRLGGRWSKGRTSDESFDGSPPNYLMKY